MINRKVFFSIGEKICSDVCGDIVLDTIDALVGRFSQSVVVAAVTEAVVWPRGRKRRLGLDHQLRRPLASDSLTS